MENCTETIYDTYIEERFFQRLDSCIKNKTFRDRIRIAWLSDKALYTDLSGTIKNEFLHYSLHDESHSISILQYIYLLLGKDKIDKLSVGDLWLILEVAYSHDIGMAVTLEELTEIWKNEKEIKKIIKNIAHYSDDQVIEVFNKLKAYIEEDVALSQESNRDFKKKHSCWPIEFRKAVGYIHSEYIRRNHPERSKKKILELINTYDHLRIENRFYSIVGSIDHLHGLPFEKIEETFGVKDLGFETDKIHPRLIAMLLRVADALDIRNNRFDYWNIQYLGGLPKDSQQHYLKHKSVTEFLVDEENIKIHIESDNVDVCKTSREWLNIIDNEVKYLMKYWNAYAPRCLSGLHLQNIDLVVKYNKQIFTLADFGDTLKTDPNKLMKLLTGRNFYNSKLVIFREFLQNAIDATKIRIANEYYNNQSLIHKTNKNSFLEFIPSDLPKNVYEDHPIVIEISYETNTNDICFKITDSGIGMDEDGIQALFNIGRGWHEREIVSNIIDAIPDWIKPTGGFGIGILSAFLLSEHVCYKTKSLKGPCYIISISSPQTGGYIEKSINTEYYGDVGTSIEFSISFSSFMMEMNRFFTNNYATNQLHINHNSKLFEEYICKLSQCDLFKKNTRLEIVALSLKMYLQDLIIDSYFPISIQIPELEYENILKENQIWDLESDSTFWNHKNNTIIRFDNNNESGTVFAYKGIKISKFWINNIDKKGKLEEKILYNLTNKYIKSIDIFQGNVDKILEISRDDFSENYQINNLIKDSLFCFIENDVKPINISDFYDLVICYYDFFKDKANQFSNFISSFELDYYFNLEELYKFFIYYSEKNLCDKILNLYDKKNDSEGMILADIISIKDLMLDILNSLNDFVGEVARDQLENDYLKNIFLSLKEIISPISEVSKISDIESANDEQIKKIYDIFTNACKQLDDKEKNMLEIGLPDSKKSFIKLLIEEKEFYIASMDAAKHNQEKIISQSNIDKFAKNDKVLYLKNYDEIVKSEILNEKFDVKLIESFYHDIPELKVTKISAKDYNIEKLEDRICTLLKKENEPFNAIEIENIDISGYEELVLNFNPLKINEQESIILNPFNKKATEPDLQLDKLLKYKNEYSVKKAYTNSQFFKQLVQIVYEANNESDSKITIDKIQLLYLQLILNVLKLYKNSL